jgi:hypothetical protein
MEDPGYLRPTASRAIVGKVLLLVAYAAHAQSVYIEGCHEGRVVEEALANDGQKPVFIGKRSMVGGMAASNVFTMNDNGFGFNVERDPEGNKLCVAAAYRDVKLNHIDSPSIPPWGLAIGVNPNGIDVRKAYKPENGGRLVFHARSYKRDSSGAVIPGKAIAIMAGVKDDLASAWSIDSKNMPDSLFNMREFKIVTSNFNHFFGRMFGSAPQPARNESVKK